MCGISGIISSDRDRSSQLKLMLREINHRGPDHSGIWECDFLSLGHNRLSILDLSERGNQPMLKGPWVIAFNGEIYNFKELRQELEMKHRATFLTNTDTEVILTAWEVWGKEALNRFRGMWAFALYNRETKELILSRDRFGIKPLYYYHSNSLFLFASEIKALLVHPAVSRRPNMSILVDYLLIGFEDHRADTFYQNIFQIPPGHSLFIDTLSVQFKLERYYNLENRVQNKSSVLDQFAATFEESIRLHLRSDVPVGTCLSGGLDSSSVAITASNLLKANGNQPFLAITAQSLNAKNDETKYAKEVVDHANLQWHVTTPSAKDFQDHWLQCQWHQDEPGGGPSVFMQYSVMKAAKQAGLKVMLDGQGGDECLLGYERYYPSLFLHWLKGFQLSTLASEFLKASRHSKLRSKDLLLYSFYFLWPALRKRRLKKRLGMTNLQWMDQSFSYLEDSMKSYRNVSSMQISEISRYQLPHLLKYEDRNSMAWSIEARVPLVDHEIVETALALQPEDKIRNGYTKWALRHSMNGKMPDSITWRRNKIGFEAPTSNWISENKRWMNEMVQNSRILKELTIPTDHTGQHFIPLFNVASWESVHKVAI